MYFDTHAHYDAEQFNADRDALLASMPSEGVDCIIDPGCDAASSRAAIALAEKYPFVYAAVGWRRRSGRAGRTRARRWCASSPRTRSASP